MSRHLDEAHGDRLRELIDRDQIGWLVNEYCRTLDVMDTQALGALFTEDCIAVYGPDPSFRSVGAGALAASIARMWRWKRTSHHLSNLQIEFDGPDAARAVSTVLAWHEGASGEEAVVYGEYRDVLVRTDVGWRFSERHMFLKGNNANYQGSLLTPFGRNPPPEGWSWP